MLLMLSSTWDNVLKVSMSFFGDLPLFSRNFLLQDEAKQASLLAGAYFEPKPRADCGICQKFGPFLLNPQSGPIQLRFSCLAIIIKSYRKYVFFRFIPPDNSLIFPNLANAVKKWKIFIPFSLQSM